MSGRDFFRGEEFFEFLLAGGFGSLPAAEAAGKRSVHHDCGGRRRKAGVGPPKPRTLNRHGPHPSVGMQAVV